MAKSKSKKVIDEEEPVEKVEADEPEIDEADEEPEVEDAEPDEPADDDDFDEPPPAPRAKITKTAMMLIFLNWVAAPIFLYFAYQDHILRTQYAHRTIFNYTQAHGLPLNEEEEFPSVSNYTRPVQKFTPEQLKKAFNERPGVTRVTEPFLAVEEEVPLRLRPSDMNDAVLKDVFWDLPDPVRTLEEEINRLKGRLPGDIENVAKEVRDRLKGDDDKRKVVEKTLLPLAWDVWQAKRLDEKLAASKGADLDKLVMESVQRRLYYDILAPLNVFRPGDLTDPKRRFEIQRIADVDKVSLEEIKGLLDKRLAAAVAEQYDLNVHLGKEIWDKSQPAPDAQKRDSIEKRRHIAFILFTLGQVHRPTTPDKKLYDKGIERAQVVSGLYEFTNASIEYVRAIQVLEDRVAASIRADREGWPVLRDKKDVRTPGFIDEYELEVDRLVKLVEQIEVAEKRLAEVKKQRDEFAKLYDERAKQYKDAMDRLLKARTTTEKYAQELRDLQNTLHGALLDLSDAGERNFQIEAEIRTIEREFMRKLEPKGVKKR